MEALLEYYKFLLGGVVEEPLFAKPQDLHVTISKLEKLSGKEMIRLVQFAETVLRAKIEKSLDRLRRTLTVVGYFPSSVRGKWTFAY